MKDKYKILSDYIDNLNAEQKPNAHENSRNHQELDDLYQTVRTVRILKEPSMPGKDYQETLVNTVKKKTSRKNGKSSKKRMWMTSVSSIAAILFFAIGISFFFPFTNNSEIVHAMEKAYQEVKAYHGNLKIVETNADGDSTAQATLNVWANKEGHYFTRGEQGANKELVTVNNGEKKWQIVPDKKQVKVLDTFPDPYRFTFELGNEIEEVKLALSTKVVGEESIEGRDTTILEVVPQGGEPYRIWIDQATNLPIQKETTMYNSIQYKITFTDFEVIEEIPNELLTYDVPENYEEIVSNNEQVLNNWTEAMEYITFTPKLIDHVPTGFTLDKIAVIPEESALKLYYMNPTQNQIVTLVQKKIADEFIPNSNAILGKVDNQVAEILSPLNESSENLADFGPYAQTTNLHSVRWQKGDLEYEIVGNSKLEIMADFIENLISGEVNLQPDEQTKKGQIEVPVDLEVEENDQKSADSGHSVFKLDPVFTAQVFVSLKISPEGIQGEYPIKETDLHMIENTGKEAIVEVIREKTPIKRVYLKRLIRQDSTGIWTVVGYDPIK